ncbi:furin-like prohormone convertase precursor [Aplysia californica]|uniref:Furin-like prohormone convertase n=1 Tax=Aplysia californica TaxID=6500 RepID=Q16962_APLCA|nr:furin-like prohormone convertase precursor [Aplysia californica]AAA73903.1 furin-like prohormone convertase [Aplysia californica]
MFLALVLGSVVGAEVYLNQFAVHISGGHSAASRVARDTGFINLGQIGSLDDHYLFEIPHRQRRSATHSHEHHTALTDHGEVGWFEQQVVKSRSKRDFHPRDVAEQMSVLDPYWKNQWYLHGGAQGGYDMKVMEAWREGYTGKNIVVAILDDGLEHNHPDLIKNYDPYASYDLNDHDNDPMPRYDASNENRHGTRCAGEVSAEANNTACTIGIAPDSRIGGIRMLDGEVYDAVEAASLSFNRSHVDIYSASWGPDDDGKVVDGPGKLAKEAFIKGIENGRGGKGSIFVWASGNGGSAHDSCNCDGYANSIFTLSISSTSENGIKPWYLEECSSTLASTYSSGAYNERQIATTDLRQRCTTTHTGTSASAPLAAGIVALVLEANRDLTWRDVQYITLMTSRSDPIEDGQWIVNGVGRKVSLRYGYGLMDATEMVKLAKVWRQVPEKHECLITSDVQNVPLASGNKFSSQVLTNGCVGTSTEVNYLEHVQARISLTHSQRGSVVIYLTSPSGTRSKVLPARSNDVAPGGFDNWPLLSVHFWGENPRGTWTLEIEEANMYNRRSSGGKLASWSLVLHGTRVKPVRLLNETSPATTTKTTAATTSSTSTTTTKKPSTPKVEACHKECAGGCTGTRPEDCNECKNFRVSSTRVCVSQCPDGFYTSGDMCMPCDASCATCSGPALTECQSCHEGRHYHQLKDKHSVCNIECVDGFFYSTNSCLPCDVGCKHCESSALHCTACRKGYSLKDDKCVSQAAVVSVMFEHITLSIVLISVIVLLVVFIFMGLLYMYRNQLFFWSDRKMYGPVPREDEEAVVRLTYSDDFDEDFKS